MTKKRRIIWVYLLAAVIAAITIRSGFFVYRFCKYGLIDALNGYPKIEAMPELGGMLRETEYKSVHFSWIGYEPSPTNPKQILKIIFNDEPCSDASVFIREALEIRKITEYYIAAHPEQFENQHIYLSINGFGGFFLFPNYITFRNYDPDNDAKPETGGLAYGKFQVNNGTMEMLKDADDFNILCLRRFQPPADLSAFNQMDSLRRLELQPCADYTDAYEVTQEELDAFAKQHPDCKLLGAKAIKETKEVITTAALRDQMRRYVNATEITKDE